MHHATNNLARANKMQLYNTTINLGYTQHEDLVTQVLYNHTTNRAFKVPIPYSVSYNHTIQHAEHGTESNYNWNTMQIDQMAQSVPAHATSNKYQRLVLNEFT